MCVLPVKATDHDCVPRLVPRGFHQAQRGDTTNRDVGTAFEGLRNFQRDCIWYRCDHESTHAVEPERLAVTNDTQKASGSAHKISSSLILSCFLPFNLMRQVTAEASYLKA